MKKVFSLSTIFLILVLSAFLFSCTAAVTNDDNSTDISSDIKPGDIASNAISFGGNTYKYTGEVYVVIPETTGYFDGSADHPDIPEDAGDNYKGVFTKGRKVTLSPYVISQYEVTQDLYIAVMSNNNLGISENPTRFKDNPDKNEIQEYRCEAEMTWYDAIYFCNQLTEKVGNGLTKAYKIDDIQVSSNHITSATVTFISKANGYRLPTEAEWEFAARGGDPTKPEWNYLFSGHPKANNTTYNSSPNEGLDTIGWYNNNSNNKSHQVGIKKSNSLNIFDMSGNVLEFCFDMYDTIQKNEKVTNPLNNGNGTQRVMRGGSHFDSATIQTVCKREPIGNYETRPGVGFRICRSIR